MKIRVKRKHIRWGRQEESDACAIALALMESFGAGDVTVGAKGASVYGIIYSLPKKAQKFIAKFDKNKSSVKPFEFTL